MPAFRGQRKRAPAIMVMLPEVMYESLRNPRQIDRATARDRRVDTPQPALAAAVDTVGWRTTWLDILQVNPVLETPRLIAPSFSQPIIRWGFRKWDRSYMRARPRFSERFINVGRLLKQVPDRKRMAGVNTRQAAGAYNYLSPQFSTAQKAVVLLGPPK